MKHLSPRRRKPTKISALRVLLPARVKRLRLACRSFRKKSLIELPVAKTRCVCFASGAVERSSTSRTRLTSDTAGLAALTHAVFSLPHRWWLSFFVDIGTSIVLRAIEVPVIPGSVISFGLATAANYFLCVVLAFERGRLQRYIEIRLKRRCQHRENGIDGLGFIMCWNDDG